MENILVKLIFCEKIAAAGGDPTRETPMDLAVDGKPYYKDLFYDY